MSASERQKRWRDGKNRKGMTRLDIWVPTDRVSGLRALVSDLITYPDMALIGMKEEEPPAPDMRHDKLSEFEEMQAKREAVQLIAHCDRSCIADGGPACVYGENSGLPCIAWQVCEKARSE